MVSILLSHKWKQFTRSTYFSQGLAIKLVLGFLGLYFFLLAVGLGFLLGEILSNTDDTPVHIAVGRFLLIYIFFDIVVRFFMNNLTVLEARHYLLLNVKKSRLIHFLLASSVINYFSILSLAILLPFFIFHVTGEISGLHAVSWLIALLSIITFNHYVAAYFKRISAVNTKVIIGAILIVGILGLMTYLEWFSIYDISHGAFKFFLSNSIGGLLLIVPVVLIYRLNFNLLADNIYEDKWLENKSTDLASDKFNFIAQKGLIGTLIAQELKLIMRNKRTKNIFWVTVFFAFYGLLFYPAGDQYTDSLGWMTFLGVFMTGAFMINYGQFLTAWESSSFDGIMTRRLSVKDYYQAKWVLLVVSSIIMFIITLPYAYFGWKIIYMHFVCLIFNIGFNSFILLFASVYNKKRIDLSRGSMMNYQGTGATQFLIIIPLVLFPILIVGAFAAFNLSGLGIGVLVGFSLISLAFYPIWMKEIVQNFNEKKYSKAAGFRHKM